MAMLSSLTWKLDICTLYILVGACTALVTYWLWRTFYKLYLSPLRDLPGLPFNPIWGSIRESIQGEAMESSVKWVRKYGPVVRYYNLFGSEAVLVAGPEAVRHVLVTNSFNYPRPRTQFIGSTVPEGLVGLSGPLHRSERKLLNPSFNTSAIEKSLTHLEDKTSEFLQKINELSDTSQPINIYKLFHNVTLDIIGLLAFNHDFQALSHPNTELVQAIDKFVASQHRTLLGGLPFYNYLPTSNNRITWSAMKTVHNFCDELLDKLSTESDTVTVMGKLMNARYDDKNEGLSRNALRDHFLTFIIGGHDTTSATMAFLILELVKNLSAQSKLREELNTLPRNSNGLLETNAVLNSKIVDAFTHEILRLRPVAPSVARRPINDDIINGYKIPAGTNVVVHLGAMMRTCVENGDAFKPERHLAAEHPLPWLPFGLGPHTCIGNKLALAEIKVIVSNLLSKFELTPTESIKDVRRKYRFAVMRPIPDVCVYAQSI